MVIRKKGCRENNKGGMITPKLAQLRQNVFRLRKQQQKRNLLTPLGELVEVNGHNMSAYTEGDGDKTFVFMSGSGTCSPILDFKSLYSLLSNEYKIAVVEKFGYGFSDVVDKNRRYRAYFQGSRNNAEIPRWNKRSNAISCQKYQISCYCTREKAARQSHHKDGCRKRWQLVRNKSAAERFSFFRYRSHARSK